MKDTSKKAFYITTPIYYPNGKFHIGTAYTTHLADTLKKYKQQRGYDVYMSTGNDEHGQKIQDTAIENGKTPQEFVDIQAEYSKKLWEELKIDYDFFVRTSDEPHKEIVQKIFTYFKEKGDIYIGKYKGNYCKSCESYFTDAQAVDKKCPDCGKDTKNMEEEAYFFNMKKYVPQLLDYYEKHPDFILPESRKNEIVNNFLKPGLEDLCVTRTSFDWGVKLKEDPKHVIYVWLDALTNYITLLGYGKKGIGLDKTEETEQFQRYWPASVHIVGKDIIRFHGIYWPIFLMALGLELPKHILAHNWYIMKDGKMSKSKGNVIYPEQISREYGTDVLKYMLVTQMPYTHDGVFTADSFVTTYNNELSNDFGNLIHRTIGMVKKYDLITESKLEYSKYVDKELEQQVLQTVKDFEESFEVFMIQKAKDILWQQISNTNKYIDLIKPWELYKEGKTEELNKFIFNIYNVLRIVNILIQPLLPDTYLKMQQILNFTDEQLKYTSEFKFEDIQINPELDAEPLFNRLDKSEIDKILGILKSNSQN